MQKKIIGIGGGKVKSWNFDTKDENQDLYETEMIDKEIVKLSKKNNPKLLFVGTASRENPIYYQAIKKIYENLGCRVDVLEILNKNNDIDKIRKIVLSSDIIYIGGGNTKFMLNEWRNIQLDKVLLEAYSQGIVIAGFSAGCYCWFKYNYELIEGLGIIKAINCVHYNEKSEEKRKEFYEVIKEKNMIGIALENGTAIECIDDKYKIIKSIKSAKAYKIRYVNNEFMTEELKENVEFRL